MLLNVSAVFCVIVKFRNTSRIFKYEILHKHKSVLHSLLHENYCTNIAACLQFFAILLSTIVFASETKFVALHNW